MENLDLLPLDALSLDKKVESFKLFDQTVKRNIPEILLATMDLLYKLYGNIKSSFANTPLASPQHHNLSYRDLDQGKEQKLYEIRMKARALVMFSGMIQYKMSADITGRLVKLECFMAS